MQKLPNDIEAEQAVLGSCLINENGFETIEGRVVPSDFYDFKNQIIFEAIEYLFKEETKIDLVTLSARLKAMRSLSKVGGNEYLASLANKVPTASHIKHYAKTVAELSLRRKLLGASERIKESAYNEKRKIDEVLEQADKEIVSIIEGNSEQLGDEKPMGMADIALQFDEDYDKKEEIGMKLGIPALDNEINGLGGGELIGLTGESGAGKTAFCLGVALKVAQSGKKVLFFNLEMSNKDICSRLISIYSGVDNTSLRRKTMDRSVVDVALCKLSEINLKIVSPSWITSAGVGRISTAEKKKNGVDLIVVDYINELKDEGREEKDVIESALRNLKPLAVKLNVPILVPFQMNYSGLNKQTPSQQDGRSSSKLANVYGVMLSLKLNNTPEITLQQGEQQVDLWITKNRHGRSKIKIPLKFQGNSLRFSDK